MRLQGLTRFLARTGRLETLRNLAFFGAGGVAFAAANLLFARALPVEEYALMTLLVAIATLGYALGPVGLDGVALRAPRTLPVRLIVGVAAGSGLAVAVAAAAVYAVPAALAAAVGAAAAAGSAMFVAAATFRRDRRFALAILITQAPNVLLLAAALASLALGAASAGPAVAVLAFGLVGVAGSALWPLARQHPHLSTRQVPWREALALGGASLSTMMLVQMERLTIPEFLPLSDLALFGVLGAFAGSVFRVLQIGVGFSLLPKLRAAPSVLERRRLIGSEAALALVIAIVGSIAIVVLAPLVETALLAGKYELSLGLLIATIVSGTAKIAESFARTVGTALAGGRELSWINALGFVSVGVAFAAAFAGARHGLVGLIYGVAAAWLFRAIAVFAIVVKHLRLDARVPATAACSRT